MVRVGKGRKSFSELDKVRNDRAEQDKTRNDSQDRTGEMTVRAGQGIVRAEQDKKIIFREGQSMKSLSELDKARNYRQMHDG
jgi:hypothetical protein